MISQIVVILIISLAAAVKVPIAYWKNIRDFYKPMAIVLTRRSVQNQVLYIWAVWRMPEDTLLKPVMLTRCWQTIC